MTDSWQEVWQLREELYSFFGNCLLKPIDESNKAALSRTFWDNFPLETANEQMKSGLELMVECTSKLEVLSEEEAIQKVMIEYTALFLGPGRPQAPPWESVYRTPERLLFGWPAFDVRETMRLYGIEIRKKYQQPEDHIGLELIFLSVVSEKLKESVLSQQTPMIREQINFIDKHLLSWIPELCRDAKLNGSVGYYGGLIELIWGVLLWDYELLEEFLTKRGVALG
ncbi:TorD/DmsD family molecular chaperone [Desulfitobacterium sp. AusDCA]|uniref:TorD/DmsD family molecular chaperone n=1 Tax=Desulfitobacterium sp. AusDCA TaxID=3240383 RepID=UPI003DA78C5F